MFTAATAIKKTNQQVELNNQNKFFLNTLNYPPCEAKKRYKVSSCFYVLNISTKRESEKKRMGYRKWCERGGGGKMDKKDMLSKRKRDDEKNKNC